MNFFFIFLFFLTINISLSTKVISKESWLLDKNLSSIEFELPVLFANNVQGKFEEINGIIEIDLANKANNKAIFSVKINSKNMNYKKYKEILLSDIFFDSYNFPVALVDTKKFSY